MDYKNVVKDIVEVFEKSNVATMDVELLGLRISLSKEDNRKTLNSVVDNDGFSLDGYIDTESVDALQVDKKETYQKNLGEVTLGDESETVKAPLVGTVYLSPEPEKPTFVKVGDIVKEGESMCIIEAMKMMNELKAPYDLTIKNILVDNAQMVEFGQDIFEVEKC